MGGPFPSPSGGISGPGSVALGYPLKWVNPSTVAQGTVNLQSWYVDSIKGSDSNSGRTINDPFASLSQALSVATADAYGDTIFLAKGFLLNEPISITKSCNIVSLGSVLNEPARFGNGATVTIIGSGNMNVSFAGVAFVANDNLPFIINDAESGPVGVSVNLQNCRFNYSYSSAFSGIITSQIQLNATCTLTGTNNNFGGAVTGTSTVTRNTMIQLANVAKQQLVNLSNTTYNSTRFTAGVQETFFYSQNTAPQTQVQFNGIYHTDLQETSDETISDVFMRDEGCAHSISVTNYVFKESYQTSPSGNPILRIANSNNTVSGTATMISNVLVDYGPLQNAQIALANATAGEDTVVIRSGFFFTTGAYELSTSGSGLIVGDYIDGSGKGYGPYAS